VRIDTIATALDLKAPYRSWCHLYQAYTALAPLCSRTPMSHLRARLAYPVASGGGSGRLEWTARIRCNQHELGGSFSVLIFLLKVPDNPAEWFTSPNFVGSFDAFVGSPDDSYRSQSDHDIEGFVCLDAAILKHSGQESLERDVVVPFLTDNIHWRAQKADGTVAELMSLEVVVLATPVTMPPGAKYPVYGKPQEYPSVTSGRPGGSRPVPE